MREARHTEIPWVQHHLLSIQKRSLSLPLPLSFLIPLSLLSTRSPFHFLTLTLPVHLPSCIFHPLIELIFACKCTCMHRGRNRVRPPEAYSAEVVRYYSQRWEERGKKRAIRSHKINRETDFWWACVHAAPRFVSVCVWACSRVCTCGQFKIIWRV